MDYLQRQKESKEDSLRVMKELNSVLAVRNVEKQRKRELREREKLDQSHTLGEVSVNNNSRPTNHPEHGAASTILEMGVALSNEEGPAKPTTAAEKQADENKMSESLNSQTQEPFHPLPSSGEPFQYSSSAIAQAVAAAALRARAGRPDKEETFYDHKSYPSSETEEDSHD